MKVHALYEALRERHGEPGGQWVLWCKRPKTINEKETVIIESVLTQRANWNNVCLAVANLKNASADSLEKILSTEDEKLQHLIRPSGFYKIKSERLKSLASFIVKECGGICKTGRIPAPALRKRLLSLNGIGDETADDILLYAFEKPVFVIDEYTRRLARKLELTDNFSYRHMQEFFEKGLGKRDYRLYQDFHSFIVMEGKEKTK